MVIVETKVPGTKAKPDVGNDDISQPIMCCQSHLIILISQSFQQFNASQTHL